MSQLRKPGGGTGCRAASMCAAAFTLLGSLTACSGGDSTTHPPQASGVIEGRFLVEGGPAPGISHPMAGTVFVRGPSSVTLTVGPDGRFRARVAIGTYRLAGHPQGTNPSLNSCPGAHPVTVTANHTTRLDVICEVP